MKFKVLIKKFIFKYFERFTDPYFYTRILRDEGIQVGERTIFYDPKSMNIDRERPWMLRIGNYCKITKGVTILTHDYSRAVLRRVYREFIGEAGMTIIGDNVFIGINSIILMGSIIGNNSIVGAGSVVKGNFPDNVVIAGNPAKVICSLDEYYKKRKQRSLFEAKIYIESYKERYGVYPGPKSTGPFFYLYESRETFDYDNDTRLHCNGDNIEEIKEDFRISSPLYKDYETFLRELGKVNQ